MDVPWPRSPIYVRFSYASKLLIVVNLFDLQDGKYWCALLHATSTDNVSLSLMHKLDICVRISRPMHNPEIGDSPLLLRTANEMV